MTDEKTLRSISIDTLKLSVRAQNVLHRAGKHTLFELLPCTEEELFKLPSAGRKTVQEILQRIAEYRTLAEADAVACSEKEEKTTPASPKQQLLAAVADETIDVLGLPTRAYNLLVLNDRTSLSSVLFLSEQALGRLPRMDPQTAYQIWRSCQDYLAALKETLPKETAPAQPELLALVNLPQHRQAVLDYVKSNDQPIEVLGLNNRAVNQLKNNGYRTLIQILFLPPTSLQAIRNMGTGAVKSVIDSRERWLREHEAELRAILSDAPLSQMQESDEKVCRKLLRLYESAPDAGLSRQDFADKLPEIPEKQRDRCVGKLLAGNKLEYVDFRCYRVYPHFADAARDCPKLGDREREIVLRRLQGETLDAVAQSFDLTRERVRQIVNKEYIKIQTWTALQTGMPRFDEDYYLYFYETYELDRQDAEQWFGLTTPVLRYLDLIAKGHRRRPLEEATSDPKLGASLRQRIRNYLNRNKLYLNGQWLPKQRDVLERYVVTRFCKEDTVFTEFCQRYNDFLRAQDVPFDEDIYITDANTATRRNKLRDDRYLLWKHGERLRAYDMEGRDFSDLLEELGLSELENIEISTAKLMEEHPEILARYDVRDQYELHNLLRKLVPEGSWHGLKYNRAPNLLFGTFDRDAALLELMLEHAPISQADLAELIRQEYGYDPGVIIGTYLVPLADYYHQGMYTIDQKVMTESHRAALLSALSGDFFFLDELKRIYQRCVPGADPEEINPYNLKQMGFTVLSRYALRNYDSLDAFFRALLTREDFTDLAPLRQRYCYVMMFSQILNTLKRDLDVLEFEPGKLVCFEKLAAAGITKQELRDFRDAVYDYLEDGAWFSAASLRQSGFDAPLYELGFSDWFYGSLLSTDPRFGFSQIFKSIILHKGEDEVTARSFETTLIRAEGSIDVYDLQKLMEQTYGCTIPDHLDLIYKVAESGVYYDKHLDRLYESEALYWREVDEAEAQQ